MHKKVVRKNSQSRVDEMVNALRNEIGAGEWGIGSHLPSESDLEKRFKLGNNSVRKGLEQLVEEGLIQKIPRVGNRVIGVPSAEHTVIKLGIYNTTDRETELSGLLETFHARHPNIRVQTVMIPTNAYTGFIQQHMAEGSLDAAFINNNTYRQFSGSMKTELLEPLKSVPDYYPFTTEPFRMDGRLLVRPLMFSPLILCYNRDHMREQNLPEPVEGWTWDDLIGLAGKLSVENERFGFCFHLLSRNRWPVFLLQSGIDFTPDGQGRFHLPEDRLTECLSVCRELIGQPNVFPTMLSGLDGTTVEWFMDGKVSMIMTTYFALNQLKRADFAYDLAPLPTVRENRNLLNIIGLIVNRKSRNKEAAALLADFLGSYEAQLAIRRQTLSIPAHREAAEWQGDAAVSQPSNFRMFREMIPSFRLIEHLPLDSRELLALQKELELYLTGLQDGSTMCRRMEQALYETNRIGS
jgi:multiple sugar transport system substrate-binding protein